jgi:hypothetical protein
MRRRRVAATPTACRRPMPRRPRRACRAVHGRPQCRSTAAREPLDQTRLHWRPSRAPRRLRCWSSGAGCRPRAVAAASAGKKCRRRGGRLRLGAARHGAYPSTSPLLVQRVPRAAGRAPCNVTPRSVVTAVTMSPCKDSDVPSGHLRIADGMSTMLPCLPTR